MTDRLVAGRATYARNFGVDQAEAERILTERVGADFTREVFEAAGGLGWQGTSLTDRDRSIAIIAALLSQNVTDARLLTYLTLARRNGVDEEALTALIVLLTAYVGQPYPSVAMQTVHRSAAPLTPDPPAQACVGNFKELLSLRRLPMSQAQASARLKYCEPEFLGASGPPRQPSGRCRPSVAGRKILVVVG